MIQEEGFDTNGLRYSIEELNKTSPIGKSMSEISKYVDAITFAMVKNKKIDSLNDQLIELPEGIKIEVSLTGLGNLAYVALNGPNDEIKEKALRIYNQIINGRQL